MSEPVCPLCQAQARRMFRREYRGRIWWLARCRCGAHFTFPRPTAADIPTFYEGGYHASLLQSREDSLFSQAKFRRYIDDFQAIFPRGRVLDVGCATGVMPAQLRDAGYDAEGLEINPKTAAFATATHGLTVHTGSFEQFDEANGPYDLLVMTDLVEHTEDPINTMRKVNRLLKPGGGAYIRFPDICSLKSRYYHAVAKMTGRDWLWMTCQIPQHTIEFTRPVAAFCFERAGFTVVKFGRRESRVDDSLGGKFLPLAWPVRPLHWPWLARRFGTQMAFVLRKTADESNISLTGIAQRS